MPQIKFKPVPLEHEPKKQNRFSLIFPTEIGIESYLVQTVSRPSATINMKSYKAKWDNMRISFVDPIGPSTSSKIYNWMKLQEKSRITRLQEKIFSFFCKNIKNKKIKLILQALDPTGIEIERFVLNDCEIVEVNFGNNDYTSEELLMPWIIIKIKSAELVY